jgi:hypothetical protein
MELFTLGIDLGKTTFHVVGMSQRGQVVLPNAPILLPVQAHSWKSI